MYFRPLTNILRNCINHHCTKLIIRPNHGKNVDNITKEVVIIGNTWTAVGLASLALQSGHRVKLVDTDVHKDRIFKFRPKILEDLKAVAKKKHKGNFPKQDKFAAEAIDRLQMAPSPDKFFSTADIVIDAISFGSEGLIFWILKDIFQFFGHKRWLLKQWSKKAPSNSVFVYARRAPTSGFENSDIFHSVIHDHTIITSVFRRRSDIVEVNLVDPIPKYKLAEIKKLYGLTGDTIKRTMLWLKEMDIDGVVVQETGDIKKSMVKLHNLLHKVENGSMTVSDIDLVTKINSTNHFVLWVVSKMSSKIAVLVQYFMISTTNFAKNPIGPFEMADFIGLDKAKSIIDDIGYQEQVDGGDKYKENMLLKYLIKEGKLGRKTGEGFYTYNKLPSDKIVVLDKSRHTLL